MFKFFALPGGRLGRKMDVEKLKERIKHRLATEDYTCRLPKPPKPRVRYKLRFQLHREYAAEGYLIQYDWVYK